MSIAMKKLWVVASALAVTLFVLTAVRASADPAHDWAAGLPGCDPSRPAVAHYAGGVPLVPQPTNGPVPCGVLTGRPTVENRIEVTNDNTVIYMPALIPDGNVLGGCGHGPGLCVNNTVGRTIDEGAHWVTSTATTNPAVHDYVSADVDNNLYVDHGTGRLFYYDSGGTIAFQPPLCGDGGNGATIFFSDDSGATWSFGYDPEHNCSENPTILVGRPSISNPSYAGGVVYLCGNNFGTGAGGAGSTGKVCSKSLDGGLTWVGQFFQ